MSPSVNDLIGGLGTERHHSCVQEIRDLFAVSIIADLEAPLEHDPECSFVVSDGQDGCSCPFVPTYFLGRRALPEMGVPSVNLTGSHPPLSALETYCEKQIEVFRARARAGSFPAS